LLALLVLLGANLGLALIVWGGMPALADVVTPLTGHLIGLGLAAAVALLARRHTASVLALGIGLTIALHAWLGVSRCCGATGSSAATAGEHSFSVLTLNTWDSLDNLKPLARYLATAPADIVILSEFGPPKRPLLDELRGVYPHQTDCAAEWECSLALLSRIPFEAGGASRVAGGGPAFVWARAGEVTVIGTHLYRPSRSPSQHAREVQALGDFIRRIEGAVVLAGDLNTSPWSNSFRTLRAETGLAPAALLIPSWPAWPLALPQVALDHVLLSPELAVTASGTGPAVGSDHLPVWARLRREPATVQRGRPAPRTQVLRFAAARAHLGGELLADLGGKHGRARDLSRRQTIRPAQRLGDAIGFASASRQLLAGELLLAAAEGEQPDT
jgi:endonuclease/exonuclease/phosphatase (EEP) superfamily protein YafD